MKKIGAEEILEVLRKNPKKKFTTKEIAEFVDVNIRSIRRIIHDLLREESGEVFSKCLTKEEKGERFKEKMKNYKTQVYVYWVDKPI